MELKYIGYKLIHLYKYYRRIEKPKWDFGCYTTKTCPRIPGVEPVYIGITLEITEEEDRHTTSERRRTFFLLDNLYKYMKEFPQCMWESIIYAVFFHEFNHCFQYIDYDRYVNDWIYDAVIEGDTWENARKAMGLRNQLCPELQIHPSVIKPLVNKIYQGEKLKIIESRIH